MRREELDPSSTARRPRPRRLRSAAPAGLRTATDFLHTASLHSGERRRLSLPTRGGAVTRGPAAARCHSAIGMRSKQPSTPRGEGSPQLQRHGLFDKNGTTITGIVTAARKTRRPQSALSGGDSLPSSSRGTGGRPASASPGENLHPGSGLPPWTTAGAARAYPRLISGVPLPGTHVSWGY